MGTVQFDTAKGYIGEKKVEGMRLKFMDYFYYAIAQGMRFDSSNLGKCEDVCQKWSQKCCAAVTLTSYRGDSDFQYHCINQAVADFNINMEMDDFKVSMSCDNTWSGASRLAAQAVASAAMVAYLY